MIEKLTQNEKRAIVEYCNSNENHWGCKKKPFKCLENIIKEFLNIEVSEDTEYVDTDILNKIVPNLQTLANYFNLEWDIEIYDRDTAEKMAKWQLREQLEEDILDIPFIKDLAKIDLYKGWFRKSPYYPYFEVLTYGYLRAVVGDLIDLIKEKVGLKPF